MSSCRRGGSEGLCVVISIVQEARMWGHPCVYGSVKSACSVKHTASPEQMTAQEDSLFSAVPQCVPHLYIARMLKCLSFPQAFFNVWSTRQNIAPLKPKFRSAVVLKHLIHVDQQLVDPCDWVGEVVWQNAGDMWKLWKGSSVGSFTLVYL